MRLKKVARDAEQLTVKIDAVESKVSEMPVSGKPSPEAGMDTMRKAVAENDLTDLKNERTRTEDHERE